MKALTIYRICEQFPPAAGGLSRGMFDLSKAQHEKGHNITVITPSFENDESFDRSVPFPIMRIPAKKMLLFGWNAYKMIARLAVRPDIIHSHGPGAWPYAMFKKKTDPPLVHSIHAVRRYQYRLYYDYLQSNTVQGYPRAIKYSGVSPYIFREYRLEKMILQKADHLVLVADYFADEITKYYGIPTLKMTTVYNGSNFRANGEGSFENRSEKENGTGKKLIMFVGRFDWHKRIDLLIRAFAIIAREDQRTRLVLIGHGEMYPRLVDLVNSLNLKERVLFTGWVEKKMIIDYYRQAACLCLPSLSEGLPKVLLEAISMGVPVIAADNRAAVELLRNGQYGSLAEASTPEAWSRALNEALEGNREIDEKAKNASHLLDTMFRWDHVAERIDTAYKKTLAL